MSEVRGQKTGVGSQLSDVGCQRTDVGRRRKDDGGKMSEGRREKWEFGMRNAEDKKRRRRHTINF